MSERRAESYWRQVADCAAAIDGDARALAAVREDPELVDLVQTLRLGSALAVAADEVGIEPAAEWHAALQSSMAAWLLVDRAAATLGESLGEAGHRWAPIKGFDVGTRFHGVRESRETSDLDVLVSLDRFPEVRQRLESAGWTGWWLGPRAEAYMREEGYAWQASRPSLGLLEVHFRFWGVVPDGLEREALARADSDPVLGTTALRLTPEYCYLIAAVHAWTQEVPRSLNDWRDMEQIARRTAGVLAERVVSLARHWELQLPVALSAFVVNRLWPSATQARVLGELQLHLRPRERLLLDRLQSDGPDGIPWSRIALARLLAGRPSRAGWRSVWRRLWAHPGEVERTTPTQWSWPRRRLHHLWNSLAG